MNFDDCINWLSERQGDIKFRTSQSIREIEVSCQVNGHIFTYGKAIPEVAVQTARVSVLSLSLVEIVNDLKERVG